MEDRSSQRGVGWAVAVLALVVGGALFVQGLGRLWGLLVIDDAYITFRYAANWAAGHGPTWNPGEPPAEGYSAPLWMALLALVGVLGADVPAAGRILGLVFALGTVPALAAAVWRATTDPRWAVAAAGLWLAHPYLPVWAVGQMETSLYVLAWLLALWLVLDLPERPSSPADTRRWVALGLVLAATGLLRTEGPILAIAFLVVALDPSADDDERPGPRPLALLALALAGVWAAHVLIRLGYYGLWLPLPAFEKGGSFKGAGMVRDVLRGYLPFVLVALVAPFRLPPGRTRRAVRFSLVSGSLLAAVVLHVDPVMSAFHRYLIPAVPLLFFVAVLGFRALTARVGGITMAAGMLGLLLASQGADWLGGSRRQAWADLAHYSGGVRQSHGTLGRWLADHVSEPRDTTMVIADCGLVPYLAGVQVVDTFGLNDPHVARHGVDLDYLFDTRDPELVVLTPLARDQPLRRDPRLRERYVLHSRFEGYYPLELWRRRDVALPPR